MPYLTAARKIVLDEGAPPINAGDLTYLLCKAGQERSHDPIGLRALIAAEIDCYLAAHDDVRYEQHCVVMGALVCSAYETARRCPGLPAVLSFTDTAHTYYQTAVAPYEEAKRLQNGDVFTCD